MELTNLSDVNATKNFMDIHNLYWKFIFECHTNQLKFDYEKMKLEQENLKLKLEFEKYKYDREIELKLNLNK
jgi:hypothetical protein